METYKVIEGFENYSVSDFGNVKNNRTGRILKQSTTNGYPRLELKVNKLRSSKLVHVLVARAFISNPDAKRCVDHIDNIRTNNNVSNLRWATHAENSFNQCLAKNNTSGVKGVLFKKASKKWHAQIMIAGIPINLGYFTKKEDAIQARITRANEAFGVFTNSCEKII